MLEIAGEVVKQNDGFGKIIIAVLIIMALWGQKSDRGGK